MKTVPSLHQSKSELRKIIRQRRAELDPSLRQRLDAAINRQLLDFTDAMQPRAVAAYMAFDGEPALDPTLQELDRRGVRLALPVVHAGPVRPSIRFRQWHSGCEMQPNGYGILEPRDTPEWRADEIDLALIPLVAWDASGGRLGMGAGFYDRLFQPFAERARPLRMGVGYRVQQVERVPQEPWDIVLHRVLTDDACIDCRTRPVERSA